MRLTPDAETFARFLHQRGQRDLHAVQAGAADWPDLRLQLDLLGVDYLAIVRQPDAVVLVLAVAPRDLPAECRQRLRRLEGGLRAVGGAVCVSEAWAPLARLDPLLVSEFFLQE